MPSVGDGGSLDHRRQVTVLRRQLTRPDARLAELVGVTAPVFLGGDRRRAVLAVLGLRVLGGGLLRIDAVLGIDRCARRAPRPGVRRPPAVDDALIVGRQGGIGNVRCRRRPDLGRRNSRRPIQDLRRGGGRRQRQPGPCCGHKAQQKPNRSLPAVQQALPCDYSSRERLYVCRPYGTSVNGLFRMRYRDGGQRPVRLDRAGKL